MIDWKEETAESCGQMEPKTEATDEACNSMNEIPEAIMGRHSS